MFTSSGLKQAEHRSAAQQAKYDVRLGNWRRLDESERGAVVGVIVVAVRGLYVERENITIHEICTLIAERAGDFSLTGAIRVFLVSYAWTVGMERALEAVPNGPLPQPDGAPIR